MDLKGKKVTVVGLARSGAGAARLLAELGAVVTVTDRKSERELSDAAKQLPASVRYCLGGHPAAIFEQADLIVVSPGVPLDIKPLAAARLKGRRIIGELELAFQIIEERHAHGAGQTAEKNPIPFLAVTGSNGKSTTATLLNHMLIGGGRRTLFGGNIGNALTEEVSAFRERGRWSDPGSRPDVVVAELSSFQLEAIEQFRPDIAAILNITPDHLDRYHSLQEYAVAKAGIFHNQQPSDLLVLNADDAETMRLYDTRIKGKRGGPQVIFFSRLQEVDGLFVKNGSVVVRSSLLPAASSTAVVSAADIRIKGVHNLENAMAASAMALLAGCPVRAVAVSLKEFPGLEHRLELVRELEGVKYINDSKGTNVGAVLKSVESFSEPLILIAGGRDKAGDFSGLREAVSQKVKALVLIGEASEKIRSALGDLTKTIMARDLDDAVAAARAAAQAGDVVLLSPACASFDMFRDFEDRGRQFKRIVMDLEAAHA